MAQVNRIHWVDIGKGILILLLLVSHFESAIKRVDIEILASDFTFVSFWQIIFRSFFMQAFLFISGFCSNFNKNTRDFSISLLKQIIVPFCVFEMFICIYWTRDIGLPLTDVFNYWVNTGGTHYWFLNALAVSKLFVFLMIRITNKDWILLVTSFLLLVAAIFLNDYDIGSNFLCIRQSLGSIFFVVLGYVVQKYPNVLDKKNRLLIWIYPVVLLLCVILHINIPIFAAGMNVHLKSIPVFLVLSISGIYTMLYLCKLINKNSFFEYFGRNSLIVYCLHFIPLKFLVQNLYLFFSPISFVQRVFYILVLYLAEIFVCVILIEIFKYKPFKWIIGKY